MAKTHRSKKVEEDPQEGGEGKNSRSFWKGSITFGLVNIPVTLYSAESKQKLSFRLLDKRDFSPVRYQRVNEKSGKQVPWDDIVKGYEYEKDEYVVLGDADFERANVEATHTIEIVEFVDAAAISPIFFDKPYYIAPSKNGEKGYALLREVMRRTGKAGIARMVLRSREYLCAVIPHGQVLVVNLLRFSYEIRSAAKISVPGKDLKHLKISEKEIDMARQLVESMEERWDPEEFHEQYRDDLMKIIEEKIKSGKTKTIEEGKRPQAPRASKVVDITELLRRSVEEAQRQPSRRKAG